MKNNITTILFLIFSIASYSQQKLTIEECYALAEKNYPLAKQINLLQQKSTYEIDALNKAKLPKIDLNAQATYQSDVIGLPTTLPGVESLNKDQYRATLDVNQLLYNGGMIAANTKLKEAQTLTQQQQVEVNLYQLKSRINYSYMMILLWQDQRELLFAKQNTIYSKIKEVKSGVKNGAILPASEQVLEAELLKLEQALTENSFQRIKEIQNLSSLTTTTIAENAVLERPITAFKANGTRPEIKFFDLQQDQIEASKNIIAKSNSPKLNAFGQAGYGNPGLNMLNNSFEDFYIVGLKLNWNVLDWNKSKTDKQALDIAKEVVATEKETFETNNQMQLNELQSEISKIEIIIKTDSQIIHLREKVVQSFDSQLQNGVITSSDYITELNQLFDAKTNQKVHQTQLELAKINYQTIKGTH
ncbi:MAG TPA: TolC family protein [Flavobacterium sp.]|jgi:outer membrane protein TolC|uniref:TolC family protein n=1 Tax=Flavobacterium sp. TaxID=239 RepID=UPI002C958B5C|nr:TolC family protein [Flavobacterium sp.]HRM45822.1 TolC family protein [Flavobacterium sp.]